MIDTTDTHLDRLNNLIACIKPWQDKFPASYDALRYIKSLYLEKLKRFEKDEQTLNIAIMGQVKAGKSSFLNALLFDGDPVLPEAATPKTANLTRISYAEEPRLEVEFYSSDDWQRITKLAKNDADYQEVKVAKEQVLMIKQAGIDAQAYINQGSYIHHSESVKEIMGVLNDYAGNDGRFTGLVKMIRLYLPKSELKGYNIIDTPGMNDPVVSRTQRTKEEMANSDVVFFLSRASNFLDAADTDLLSKQLPEAGIKRLVLVAGQYDSAIEQDGYDRDSLNATEDNLQKRITARSQHEINKLADEKDKAGMSSTAGMLRSIATPIFSSTYAHGFANWDRSKWNDSMNHVFDQLEEMAEDEWVGYKFTQDDWQRISGFIPLKDAYKQAKDDKDKIIAEQKLGLLPEAELNLKNWLDEYYEQVQHRINTLEQGDMVKLNQLQNQYQNKIKVISEKLESVIENAILQAQTRQKEISLDLKQGIKQNTQLKSRTGTDTREDPYEVSDSTWYKPWTWGRTSTHYRTITVNYEYISSEDAIDQIATYAHECESDIEYHFSQLVNPNDIKAKLRKSLLDSLDTKSPDFDPSQFKNLLNQSISQLQLPELNMDIGDVGSMISSEFKGEVRSDEDKRELKRQLNSALKTVFETLNTEFVSSVSLVTSSLNSIRQGLETNLTENLKNEVEQLKLDLQDKQDTLKSYQELDEIVKAQMK